MKHIFAIFLILFSLLFLLTIIISNVYAASCLGSGQSGCFPVPNSNPANKGVCCGGLACVTDDNNSSGIGTCRSISSPFTAGGNNPQYMNYQCQGGSSFYCTWAPNTPNNVGTPGSGCDNGAQYIQTQTCSDYGFDCDSSAGCVTPTPPPPIADCGQAGGFCVPDATTCINSFGNVSSDPALNNSCGSGGFGGICCLPLTCSQAADVQNAKGFCSNQATCKSSGGQIEGFPQDYPDCTVDYCCWVYPTPAPGSQPSACTTGSCTPCGGAGANTCGNTNGTKTCNNTNTQACIVNGGNQTCGYYNCNAAAGYSACTGGVCTTNITINVYTDYDHSGTKNGNDAGKSGVTISDNGGNTPSTNGNGQVVFTLKAMGNYTMTMTTPANFAITKSTAVTNTGANNNTTGSPNTNTSFNLGTNNGNEVASYYVTPLYQISGNVFTDLDLNGKDNGSDTGYGGGTITVTGGPTNVANITVAGDGTWSTPANLESGNYTVTYTTALPSGYRFTTNSAWSVTVGDPAGSPACDKSTSPDAVCGGQNNGSISGLNFGITNEDSHNQSACLDMRIDNNGGGTVADMFPGPGATCGGVNGSNAIISDASCPTGSGIVYSCNGNFDFGLGSANTNNWQAGGATQECYTPPGLDNIRTSYNFLLATAQQSGITPTDMSDPSVCGGGGIADCILDPNLPKGVYIANGDLTLNNATNLPAPADPNNDYSAYIFLVNGNFEINNNIIVPQGSTAVFSASGNIDVGSGVGQNAANTADASVNTPNLEGIYSADNNFTVHSVSETNGGQVCNANGFPIDSKLNIVGAVIDNAGTSGGGQFVNNRDLCQSDLECPSVSTGDGLNYLLTLVADGQFVLHKNFNWNEVKP